MSDLYKPIPSLDERIRHLENLAAEDTHVLSGQPDGRKFCNIWGKPLIGPDVRIGEFVEIGSMPNFPTAIGQGVTLSAFCFVCPGTVIEDGCFLGPRVTILNDKYPPSGGEHWMPVHIKEGAVIGGASTILPGVTIGKGAKIGAGSLVSKDVPDGETWYGQAASPKESKPTMEDLPDGYTKIANGRFMKGGKFVKAPA